MTGLKKSGLFLSDQIRVFHTERVLFFFWVVVAVLSTPLIDGRGDTRRRHLGATGLVDETTEGS